MTHDLAVVGAGPAGLAAAVAATDHGLDVALVDAAPRPGGQYYRHLPEAFQATRQEALHHGWAGFTGLRDAMYGHIRAGRVTYLPGRSVWHVERTDPFVLHHLDSGRTSQDHQTTRARKVVIAGGAHDRSLPFPGWDLPGVMTAGGAQALLKGNLVLAGQRIVVAGSGPFLLPVAAGLASAGAQVAGVYEASRPGRGLLPGAGYPDKLIEGAGYAAALLRHRIPFRTGHAVVAAHGDTALEAVSLARLDRHWRPVPGTERLIECDTLATGYGFTPQLDLPLQLGCATRLDADGSLVVAVDAAQRTSVRGVYAAGETTGVGGAQLALAEGELAGLAAAGAAPHWRLLRRRRRLTAFARVLQAGYAVRPGWSTWLRDDTLVCRCEEVPYERLRLAAGELGAADPRATKLFTRAGMGWCQGRVCGYATACLTTLAAGRCPGADDVRGLARRPFAQPVRLSDLATHPGEDRP